MYVGRDAMLASFFYLYFRTKKILQIQDSNMPKMGLEPTHRKALVPKTSVSTISPPRHDLLIGI
jgi:hypothetical protein